MFETIPLPAWLEISLNVCRSIPKSQTVVSSWPPAGVNTFTFWDLPIFSGVILFLSCCLFCMAHYYVHKKENPKQFLISAGTSIFFALVFISIKIYTFTSTEFTFSGPNYSTLYILAAGNHMSYMAMGLILLCISLIVGYKQYQNIHYSLMCVANFYWIFLFLGWLYLNYARFSCS